MSAKVALVTGANTGIGLVTARELALQGAHVFLACRSLQKTQPVLDEIAEQSGGKAKASFLPLDLADLDSVRECANRFLEQDLPLHLLICNAGLAGAKGKTASGFELTFGTCHVGHFLLTQLLLESIKRAAPARIVVVASKMHARVNTIDFEAVHKPTRSFGALKEYSVAKLANILFAKELARQLEGSGVNTYSLHPGVVATDVWRSLPWPLDKWIKRSMLTPEEGAATSLYCATSDAVSGQSGLYYKKCKVIEPSAAAQDSTLAKKLWDASQRWVR
ncbi:MAG: SDR family oxidoreductase [Ketobacter sp.]|nr:MAG: SDR family oxidoreductase [Ketobacter sp.]